MGELINKAYLDQTNRDTTGYLGDCPSGKAFWEYFHSSRLPL